MEVESPQIDVELLKEHLVEVSEHEAELTDHLYQRLFAKRPDAEELFGTYSRPNQQRMTSETLAAVLNLLDDEPWLGQHVHAMGSRHQFSYETPPEMYPPYAEALIEALAAVSGPKWTPELARSWTASLDRINEMMTAGYVAISH